MPFKIRYKFKEDKIFYSCIVLHEQYENFKKLPIIEECEIVEKVDPVKVVPVMTLS